MVADPGQELGRAAFDLAQPFFVLGLSTQECLSGRFRGPLTPLFVTFPTTPPGHCPCAAQGAGNRPPRAPGHGRSIP